MGLGAGALCGTWTSTLHTDAGVLAFIQLVFSHFRVICISFS